jgi:pimeloyl-ACP methyl ester carboxylesterase
MRVGKSRVLGVLSAMSLLAACNLHGGSSSGAPPVPTPQASDNATPTTSASATPTPLGTADPSVDPAYSKYYDQQLEWRNCPSGVSAGARVRDLSCAKLTVPVDWSDPGGATMQLLLDKVPATGKRLGSVMTNPGGPGGSGVDFVANDWAAFPKKITANYDLVGFDPRGVGRSQPIHCLTDSQLDTFLATDPDPTTPERLAEVVQEDKYFADQCGSNNGPLLANLGTPSVARDLDVMRAATGDRVLHYMGYSYGTYIGEVYAGLYPTRVGRMVLDGVIDPALTAADMSIGQAEGFQLAYSAFVANCLAGKCLLGSTAAQIDARVAKMLAAVQTNPLPTGQAARPLNAALATTGILFAMYSKNQWAGLRLALAAAEAGNGGGLLVMADQYAERENGHYDNNQNEVIYAVNCLDHPGADTPAEIQALIPKLTQQSPVFGPFIAWGNLPCNYWPVQPTSQAGPIAAPGAPPILVIGTTRDPATPYQWAKSVASELESGVFLSRDGDGHTTFAANNSCVDEAVTNYMVDGTSPAKGTRC